MVVARNAAKDKKKTRRIGVREAARRLDVSAGHLSRVLRGLRDSRKLRKAYRELLSGTP
jgi:hypothetical protein